MIRVPVPLRSRVVRAVQAPVQQAPRIAALPSWSTEGLRSMSSIRPAVVTHTVSSNRASDDEYAGVKVAAAAGEDVDPSRAFAVVSLSGTQYKVTEGDVIATNKLNGAAVGSEMSLEDVLLVGNADKTIIGRPLIDGATVAVRVEEHTRDKKIIVFKKKRRQGYKRTRGFRRDLTILRVLDVSCEQLAE